MGSIPTIRTMSNDNEYMNQYMQSRYFLIREKMYNFLGKICASCGSGENLEIDHIDPSTKSFTLGNQWSRKWEDLVIELEKCQLLCHQCHVAKTNEQRYGEQPCGTYWKYKKYKCRCDPCILAHREYYTRFRNR